MKKTFNLEEIRQELPAGAINQIAKKVGVSKSTASHIMTGRYYSPRFPEVLEAAAEIIANHKAKERKAMQAINKAMSEA